MLPLWIIDLREKSDRRDFFESLVGKIDHVYIEANKSSEDPNAEMSDRSKSDETLGTESFFIGENTSKIVAADSTLKEQLEAIDKREANRNSVLEGNYWRYSRMEDSFYGISIDKERSAERRPS